MAKQYKAALFDLDGTLLDTIGDIHHNVNLAMQEFGYPVHTKDEVRSFVNNGALDLMTKAVPEEARDRENVEKVLKRYLEIYDKYVSVETVPYEGVVDVIHRLKDEGVLLAVVSNKPERHVKLLAEKFFGEGTFSYISGTGGDKPVKPNRECVDIALESLGVKHEDSVFIGDSNVDMNTAHNSGLLGGGVTWGFHGKDSFKSSVPDIYIDNAEQLYKLISGKE